MTPTLLDGDGLPRLVQRISVAGAFGEGTELRLSLFNGGCASVVLPEPPDTAQRTLRDAPEAVYAYCEKAVAIAYFPKLAALTAGA